jgi:N6-adenosine-specific RNA methylase IME4
MHDWPFVNSKENIESGCVEALQPFSYELIFADPAWTFATYSDKGLKKSPQAHYDCMTLDSIKKLPVNMLASENCCLFLWGTMPMLPQALEVMNAWGFVYKSAGVWHKRTKYGKTAFGPGYRVRCACEPFLLGFRGSPQNSRSHRNLIEGVVREHSRKPESSYEWCETYMPDARRCELFSRTPRPGWETWGNEAGKFNLEKEKKEGESQNEQTIS